MKDLLDRLMAEDPTTGHRATLCREAAAEIARLADGPEHVGALLEIIELCRLGAASSITTWGNALRWWEENGGDRASLPGSEEHRARVRAGLPSGDVDRKGGKV